LTFETTYSEQRTFAQCPQKHHYSYVELLTPKIDAPALRLGTGVHAGLAAHYSGEDGVEATREWANQEVSRIKSIDQWDDGVETARERGNLAVEMVAGWIDWIREKDENIEVLAVEKEFSVPLVTPRGQKAHARLRGKIDGLVLWQGFHWLMEHKTASSVGDAYIRQLQLDEQVTTYTWAIQKYMGIEIMGCIYNILRTQLPGPRVKAPLFYREFVWRNKQELERIESRLYWKYREIKRKDRPIYPNPNQFNCKGCPYWSLCVEDTPEARSHFGVRDKKHSELGEVSNGV